MFQLYKVAKLFVLPFTWLALLLLVLTILVWLPITSRRRASARLLSLVTAGIVIGLGSPLISDRLLGTLEQGHPRFDVRATGGTAQPAENWDAVVVLTGEIRPMSAARPADEPEPRGLARLLCGVEAYDRAGGRGRLVFAGNPSRDPARAATAFGEVKRLAVRLGVPDAAIVGEIGSRNTVENAQAVARLLGGDRRVLLVTSAYHVPRAVRAFSVAGLSVTPYPCDHRVTERAGIWRLGSVTDVVPSVEGLETTTHALVEYVGMLVQWTRGK